MACTAGLTMTRFYAFDVLVAGGEDIRIIKHEAVPGCGSFESDDRPSQYFYWDTFRLVG
jgi:hypothetical protein